MKLYGTGLRMMNLYPSSAFMDKSVMSTTQQDEIIELSGTAPGPMLNVMGIDKAGVGAARVTTAAVSFS